ncbi:acyltransferase domain-containing protein [Nocardia tengchongensis]|uniref:acyltransferase domain-containing protein n=1 Tax=Nocardia tengchongensis TaxID=2055889 RepID=UPI0036C1FA23
MSTRTAVVLPGQGSYHPGVLAALTEDPRLSAVLADIDAVGAARGHGRISDLLRDPAAPNWEELARTRPVTLDLALFAGGVLAWHGLIARGIRSDILIGHSLGELTALALAGSVSVTDMAGLVCLRAETLQRQSTGLGGMTALGIGAVRANHLVGLLNLPDLTMAVDNGPRQSVVSGPHEALLELERIAQAAGIRATRVSAAYPYHNRILRDSADVVAGAVEDMSVATPAITVYSPILAREVSSAADARTVIGRHLVRPVHFYDGILAVFRSGIDSFAEATGKPVLASLIAGCLPAGVQVATPLHAVSQAASNTTLPQSIPDPIAAQPVSPPAVTLAPVAAVSYVAPSAPVAPAAPVAAPTPVAAAPVTAVAPVGTAPVTAPPAAAPAQGAIHDRAQVLASLREMYAEALEYPIEVLEEDALLEADLGVDSIRQTDLMGRARTLFGLPEPDSSIRTVDFDTLGKIADYVLAAAGSRDLAQAV